MKKYVLVCAGIGLAMAFASCGSSESAYRKAYEKAKSQEAAQRADANQAATEAPTVTPVVTTPANDAKVTDNADNVAVRQERVSVVNGVGLRNFSVVVGSFSLKANAEGLQRSLINKGYDAQIVKNEERNMFRVVATTFDDKSQAAQSRDQLRSSYPDAWLLFNTK